MNPDELAGIVARAAPEEIARFIALWGEQINYVQGHLAGLHIQAIADALDEDADVSGYGTDLINDLAKALPR